MKGSLDKQASKEIILPCIRAVGATTSLKGWTKFCPGIWPFCWISKPNLPTLKQLFIYFFLSLLIFHYKKSSFFVSLPHPQLSFSTFINLSRRGKKKKIPKEACEEQWRLSRPFPRRLGSSLSPSGFSLLQHCCPWSMPKLTSMNLLWVYLCYFLFFSIILNHFFTLFFLIHTYSHLKQ